MKKRTFAELQEKKKIYKKHAERYKLAGFPLSRSKRLMCYTSLLTKAIARAGER